VDDKRKWREMLSKFIANGQYSVKTATSYAEASHALATSRFKLVIVDISLVDTDPENEDGLRLLADIDKAGLDTKVIIVTGYGTEEKKEIASQSPRLVAFIHKHEIELSNFRRLVRQAVGRVEPSQSS
jgi:DNA-binding NtrC family response regulator